MIGFDTDSWPGVVDVARLIDTYPRWRRIGAFVWWRLPPFRWLSRLSRRPNPYRRVVAMVDAKYLMQKRGRNG